MDQEQLHNPIKSIIYGNQVKNPYGNFRSFCAAISHHEQIDKIVTYLRTNQRFQKYNRFTYAFRVYEQQAFFVTQDTNNQQQNQPEVLLIQSIKINQNRLIEGYNEDQTLEGTGEKLLHLLQKFSKLIENLFKSDVENVLIISAIEQYDPLNKFEASHYRIVVERCKDLLNNLYTRVVQSESDGANTQSQIVKFQQGSVMTRTIKVPVKLQQTRIEIPQIAQQSKFARTQDKQANRPNHFYADGKPSFIIRQKNKPAQGVQSDTLPPISKTKKIKDLNQRLKNSAYSLEKILQSLGEKEYLQLKFIVKYDQNKLVEKVLSLLLMISNVSSRDKLAHEYDFKTNLENMTVNDLDDRQSTLLQQFIQRKVRKINEILRGDKRLNVYTLAEANPLISTIFAFIMLLVKSYEAGKQLLQLTQEMRQQYEEQEGQNEGENEQQDEQPQSEDQQQRAQESGNQQRNGLPQINNGGNSRQKSSQQVVGRTNEQPQPLDSADQVEYDQEEIYTDEKQQDDEVLY